MKYEAYGFVHKLAKKVLKRNDDLPQTVKLVSFSEELANNESFHIQGTAFINEIEVSEGKVSKSKVYPFENLVDSNTEAGYPITFSKTNKSFDFAKTLEEAVDLWPNFINNSVIDIGYKFAGLHYAGYIKECSQWCLPSWIWTNAAMVRYYCSIKDVVKAKALGDLIIKEQHSSGGWIVRNDYTKNGVSPQLAPNDSCYVALNCCLALYELTHETRYLESAKKTADWCQSTARDDGMVLFAYDCLKEEWITNRNIVDTGFTAGLYARLYELTGDDSYLSYLCRFIDAYIKAFYMPDNKCFSTAIDGNDRQYGGAFGRGQGWALEGLLPAYRVLKDESIKKIIDDTVDTLLRLQLKNGGWSYNLLKPLMGEDCKAVPIIAKCLLDWYSMSDENPRILDAVNSSLRWCALHTASNGDASGGIFSYTIEGAIVHHMYTNTAFVYSSAYALEVYNKINELGKR